MMSLERVCSQHVVTVTPEATILEAARLMYQRHVGCVVVVEDHRPVGILTDRDIVVKVVAKGQDPKQVKTSAVMSANPALVNINYDPLDATRLMRERGLRRLPVVDEKRQLLGIVTLDDVLGLLGKEVSNLAEAIRTEISTESAPASRAAS